MLGVKLGMMTGRGQDPLTAFDENNERKLREAISFFQGAIAEAKRDGIQPPSAAALKKEMAEWRKARH
jgi:hypothetical protein